MTKFRQIVFVFSNLFLVNHSLFSNGNQYQGIYTKDIYSQKDVITVFGQDQRDEISRAVEAIRAEYALKLRAIKVLREVEALQAEYVPKLQAVEDLRAEYDRTLNEALVAELMRRKRQQIDQKVAQGLLKKIEILQRKNDTLTQLHGEKQQAIRASRGGWLKHCVDSLSHLCSGRYGSALDTIVNRGAATAEKKSLELENIMKKIEESSKGEIEIGELRSKRERLLEDIPNELWHELEETYVKRKRFMAPALQESIEHKFVSARAADGTISELYHSFFTKALLIPTKSKKLGVPEQEGDLDAVTPDEYVQNVMRRFNENPLFGNYEPRVQNELKQLATRLVYLSHQQEYEKPYLRRGYYFWGKPLSGKSNAALLLQSILGLPVCEKRLYNAEDLSKHNLEGGEFWSAQVNIGWLVDALTTKAPDGHTYNNIILVINEIDRVFSSQNKVPEAFLLDFLDPSKKEFISPYFGNVPIDISKVTLIGTGNEQILFPGDVVPIPRTMSSLPSLAATLALPTIGAFATRRLLRSGYFNSKVEISSLVGLEAIIAIFLLNNFFSQPTKKQEPPKPRIHISDPQALARRLHQITFADFSRESQKRILNNELKKLLHFYKFDIEHEHIEQLINQSLQENSMADVIIKLGELVHQEKMRAIYAAE